jgi:tRNA threonylcarbamoyladenosine biosynthesis protein TsaE
MATTFETTAATAEEMQALAARLGARLRVGDVVTLLGPLGSGKTTFTQGMAAGAGVPPERHVGSPTFALVNEHPGRVPLVHADLYRLERDEELEELGLWEAYDRAAAAIEWADKFPGSVPRDHLEVRIATMPGGGRRLTVRAGGPRSEALAAAWLAAG